MSVTQGAGVCPAILVGLNEISQNPNNLQNSVTPLALQALLSPENTRGFSVEQAQDAGNGHAKTVRIKHKQRIAPSAIGTSKTCTAGTETTYLEESFDVSLHSELKIQLTEAQVRQYCDASSDRVNGAINPTRIPMLREMAEEIMLHVDVLRQKINSNFLTTFASGYGQWVGGANEKTFNVIKSADNAIVLTGFNQMKQELAKTGITARPIVFGGGNIDLAMMAGQYGCCNDGGIDTGAVIRNAGFDFYRDYSDMSSVLGNANGFGAFLPGSVQLVKFNKYVGAFGNKIGTMERGLFPDPLVDGLVYDMRLAVDECDEAYTLYLNLDYGFYYAPTNIFKAGDRLVGVNGVFKAVAAAI
jgi:hypothetical protein